MQDTRVILDFPDVGRNRGRFVPGSPQRILAAERLDEVRDTIREAEAAARAGAWVVGFVAYEAAPAFDPALVTHPHRGPAPLAWFAVFDGPGAPPALASAADARATQPTPPQSWSIDATRADYDTAIATIRNAIAAGDVYQVNHTIRFTAPFNGDPRAIHDALVAARHGRYHALIETADWAVISASPELFIDIRDGRITTRPMKGTARRGRWSEEDDHFAAHLVRSGKDRAENLMIVDLLRNDFGRIARFGTVAVERMFDLETYPSVHQLTSTITAQLRDDVSLVDVFAAMFPCGSITGAPKIAAMQQIAALEQSPRGPYCGTIGILRPDGSATFNVAIRSLVIDRRTGTAVYGAGGGITWDSSADAEYDEVAAKAGLLTRALPPFELIETMRLEHGRIRRLDLHLSRLAASARYFDFSSDAADAARDALDALATDVCDGVWRVRMTVSRDAHVSIARVRMDAGPAAPPDVPVEPLRVALARQRVDSNDILLYHKTTARALHDEARAAHPQAFDVLLRNEHDHITEFTIGNVVCEIAGVLLTPPLEDGLLPGTFRRQLLHDGVVREAPIHTADLPRVTRMWLINSVREWVPVRLP